MAQGVILWGLDLALVVTLLWLAWQLLVSPDLFKAIVLFIVFGLLMALIWARLGAPDVALAEAAIGAGLTGALLLGAWRRMRVLRETTMSSQGSADEDPARRA